MRVYITGVSGMLGANIAYELRNKYEVYGADLVQIHMEHVKSDLVDLMDITQLTSSINNVKPDVIIHTAAAVNVDLCEKNPTWAEELNYMVTYNLAHLCKLNNIKLIYISTDAVFDGTDNGLYAETSQERPLNVYGKTKLKGEKAVLEISNGTVLRTNIYGFNIQDKYSFGEWILYSLLKGEKLNMFTDISFSPILVNELAKVIELIIENNVSGLYHACATGSISKYEFAKELKAQFEIRKGEIIPTLSSSFDFVAKRAKNMGMSNDKLKTTLDISISTPKQGIEKFKKLYNEGFSNKLKKMR
jgi:dTDP-4-dehydrorhamnose reductase